MKIAVVHYHLRRGGVTRVIESTIAALAGSDCEILVLTGEPAVEPENFPNLTVVPGLAYRKEGNATVSNSLTDALRDAAQCHFGSMPDVWHFHNPSLGKNVLVPSVVRELAESGQHLLLQMHDFSEDGRPTNYATQRSFFDSEEKFQSILYPEARQIHYAAINNRDGRFLAGAGVPKSQLHALPNAVTGLKVKTTPGDRPFANDKVFALYPTRGIRRKNIGELLLLSQLQQGKVEFATTLSPENPEWKAIHQEWRELALELNLPVNLGICDDGGYAFTDMLGWSDVIVTTSIAEGFGLAFLEPWLVGKSVAGRNLPSITKDFTDRGINLDHLYDRLDIPLDWLDEKAVIAEIDAALRQGYLAYHRPLPSNAVDQALERWVQNGKVDFGLLSERFQREIIRKVAQNPSCIEELDVPEIAPANEAEIHDRTALVQGLYSIESYGRRLRELYKTVAKGRSGKVRNVETGKVLDQFLDPKRLNLLRT